MEKLILKSCVLVLALTLAACGQKEEDLSGLDTYTTVSGQFSQKDENGLQGTGIVRFNTSLPGITSDRHIEVKGKLPPGGSVAIVMNSDDLNLSDSKGVIFQLTRTVGGGNVNQSTGRILVQGQSVGVSTQRLAYINAADFDIIVEVHNTPTTTRVLVWRKDLLTYVLVNADVDSANASHLTSSFPSGSGQGIFAGLKLVNATVTAAQIGEAKVVIP